MKNSLLICLFGLPMFAYSVSPAMADRPLSVAAKATVGPDLDKLLTALGFEPRLVDRGGHRRAYEIRTLRGDREVVVEVTQSADGHIVLEAPLREEVTLARSEAATYLRLLELNRSSGPNRFVIRDGRLSWRCDIDATLTPAAVRKAVDRLDGEVRSMVGVWESAPLGVPASLVARPVDRDSYLIPSVGIGGSPSGFIDPPVEILKAPPSPF